VGGCLTDLMHGCVSEQMMSAHFTNDTEHLAVTFEADLNAVVNADGRCKTVTWVTATT